MSLSPFPVPSLSLFCPGCPRRPRSAPSAPLPAPFSFPSGRGSTLPPSPVSFAPVSGPRAVVSVRPLYGAAPFFRFFLGELLETEFIFKDVFLRCLLEISQRWLPFSICRTAQRGTGKIPPGCGGPQGRCEVSGAALRGRDRARAQRCGGVRLGAPRPRALGAEGRSPPPVRSTSNPIPIVTPKVFDPHPSPEPRDARTLLVLGGTFIKPDRNGPQTRF